MGFVLWIQIFSLLYFWYYCFRHNGWQSGWYQKLTLFLAPFAMGCAMIWLDLNLFSIHALKQWHNALCLFSTITALLLLPQWYKLMWQVLQSLPKKAHEEHIRLLITVLFSSIMVIAVIFFFALYYLWIDGMNGYTQGLRSALSGFQPVLVDFPVAFVFSFCCYFCLGFGTYYPYGFWFYFLMFLECLIALLNNGIVLVYAFQFLFGNKHS